MAELLLVSNPKRRKRKKARRRKMTALQRKYFAPKGHRKARRRRSKARRHHARRRPSGARPAVGYVVGTRRIRRRKLNPHRRRAHHRRRHHVRRHHRSNPSFRGFTGRIMPTVRAGGWGAAGALGLDALWGLVYPRLGSFSAYLDNPYIGFAAKAVGAVTVGAVGGRVARGRGTQLAVGAMTVVTHDFLKALLQQLAPQIFGPGGAVPLGTYLSAYLSGAAPIVGTATIPQSYLPFSGDLGGSSGSTVSDSGVYSEDFMGNDPWAGDGSARGF